ncbi:ABC-2 transporter permease [Gudongella sp. DL1XJH-153]|uniref:ABC-2 transporter permease n=1 Tax=Gudongella sp. DL1XJH-153 TaxID=3409804 RepID=UPI003BB7FAB4
MGPLIMKDIRLITSNRATQIFLLLYIPFLLIVAGFDFRAEYMYMVVLVSGAYMITILSFSYEIGRKTNQLLLSLPVRRVDIVNAKYLFVFAAFGMSGIYTGIYLGMMKYFLYSELVAFDLGMLKNASILTLLFVSVVLPLFFGLPHKVANLLNVFVFVTLFQMFGMGVETLGNIFSSPVFAGGDGVLGILIGMVLLVISRQLSLVLFQRRD